MFILGLNGFAVNLAEVKAFYISKARAATDKHVVMALIANDIEIGLFDGGMDDCRTSLKQLTDKLKDKGMLV